MQLVYERLVAAGISRFVLLDPMHDMDAVRQSARTIRRAGGTETILALTYTISAVHDDDFYAGIAAAGRRVAVHRPRLHQGPGRAADAGAGPHADPRGPGAARRQAA